MSLQQGEFAALMGPSGSGKSTLLTIIGLLEQSTGGSLQILGLETATLSDEQRTDLRGRSIGFVFQFHHLIPAFTALENVMMPLMLQQGRPTAGQRQRAAELLEQVGLADRLHFKPSRLSGGQQQRVAIARAIVTDPTILVADEPTGDLDRVSAGEILALMARLNADFGKTIIMVTHDPRAAEKAHIIRQLEKGVLNDVSA
jgi:ABC-type lipoprotein export system ATPase subunit